MIKITKKLNRNDGGNITAGSIVTYDVRLILTEKIISYDLKLFYNKEALDGGKRNITDVVDFCLRLNKKCTEKEWDSFNSSDDSSSLLQDWLKSLIDAEIGKGFTEIV